jgi:uncharacterized protein (TIRG00374 family)
MAPNEELERKVEQYEQDKKTGKKKSKKSAIKYALNISLVLIVTTVSIVLTTWNKWDSILENLAKADVKWLFAILGVMLGTIMVRSFILFCFAKLYTRDYHFHQAIAVDQVGQFYNAVTPGASGGQIMQAYTYRKQGMPVSSAVSILAMYSIVYQIILIIFGLISFIIKYDFITALGYVKVTLNETGSLNIPIWPLTIIGFILNVGVIALVFLMGYWHGFHNFIMGPVITFLHKIKIIKDADKQRENLRIQVENFKIEFRRLSTNIPFLLLVVISFTVYMIIKFGIPYFVGKALGNQSPSASFLDCILLSNYHQMITGLIPIPGSAGISEFVFYNLFMNEQNWTSGFFCVFDELNEVDPDATKTLARSSLLVWRSSTFVIPILIGGFVAAFYRSSPKNEVHAEDIPNRQTFYSLQKETYIERAEEVNSLVETSRLSREAIIEKLNPKKQAQKKKAPNKKKDKNSPANLEKQDYDEYELDDVEGGQ